jgi:hypothetical protein
MLNFSRSLQLASWSRAKLMIALMLCFLFQSSLNAEATPMSDSEDQAVVTRCGGSISSPLQMPVAAEQIAQTLERLNKDTLRSACDLGGTHTAFVVNRELVSVCAQSKRLPDITLNVGSVEQ